MLNRTQPSASLPTTTARNGKRRPAAKAETGDARGPRSYDLSRFDGQVESAEAQVAFRLMHRAVRLRVATCPQIPAVGNRRRRRFCFITAVAISRCLRAGDGETRSRPGTNSLAAGGDCSIQHDLGEN